jgi:Flp pilus assembly protein TadD
MQSRLTEHHNDIPGAGPYSFSALLEARMGRPEQALAMNTKAIKVAPHDPILHKRQAEFLFMTGDTAGALKAMEACRACAPDHAFWHFMEGRIHKKAGDMTAARKCLETACAMDDSTAELHARLSSLYKDLGETENAVLALGRAAEIAPNQQRYRNRLERLTR